MYDLAGAWGGRQSWDRGRCKAHGFLLAAGPQKPPHLIFIEKNHLLVLRRLRRLALKSQLLQDIKQQRLAALKYRLAVMHPIVKFDDTSPRQGELRVRCKDQTNDGVPGEV